MISEERTKTTNLIPAADVIAVSPKICRYSAMLWTLQILKTSHTFSEKPVGRLHNVHKIGLLLMLYIGSS
jgi:hypothetical protein